MNKLSSFIALRYIVKGRQKSTLSLISLISVVGLALAVASLITVLSVMDGYLSQMEEIILKTTSHANLYKMLGSFENYDEISKKIEKVKEIKGSSPVIFNEVLVSSGKYISGALINGVDTEKFGSVSDVPQMMEEGKFVCLAKPEICLGNEEKEKDPLSEFLGEEPLVIPPIIIGIDMAQKLKVEKGSIVTVVSPKGGRKAGGDPEPISMNFKVVGIFSTGLHDYDSRYAYTSLEDTQNFLQIGKSVSFISVRVDNLKNLEQAKHNMLEISGGFPYSVQDWKEMHKTTFKFLQIQKIVMFIILLFIVLVASFGIITTLIMLVITKTSEISILRAMGVTKSVIVRIFLTDGMIIGAAGTALGTVLAVAMCLFLKNVKFPLSKEIYFFSSLPVEMSFTSFISVIAASLTVCMIVTLYPSIKASRITPVEGLRYER